MRNLLFLGLVLTLLAIPAGAHAQDDDMALRRELAGKMEEIRPVREQIEAVVDEIARRFPEGNRPGFRQGMIDQFDFAKLKENSINAMAEVFTAAELEKMVDYFGSPEAKTIDEKMPVFQQLIQPEITKMVDRAYMTIRTGAPGEGAASPPEKSAE